MSKRSRPSDLLTIEEAGAVLGCGADKIREYMDQGRLTRRRASNGELRFAKGDVEYLERYLAHIARVVSEAPPIPDEVLDRIAVLLRPDIHITQTREPSPAELERRRKARERDDALKAAKKFAESMTACDVCNLQPDQHRYRQSSSVDMHEWQPGRAEKLMKMESEA